MPFVLLAWRFAFRNRVRTLVTVVGIGATLLAFLALRTLVASWYSVNEASARSDQFQIRHKISIMFPLYRRMEDKIRAVPGVQQVAPLIWYSGYYKEEKTRFGQLAVDPKPYFEIYPDYAARPEEMAAFFDDQSGAIVGPDLVEKYGWKIGDRIVLMGTIFPGELPLTVRGIYSGKTASDRGLLFMHYKLLQPSGDHAHRLVVKADAAAAKKIDALFANTDTPTKTESELSVQQAWASWSSGVIAAINVAAIAVLLVLTLVLGNSMSMATRECRQEYGAMRAIGYKTRHILTLVIAQGVAICAIGVAVGLLMAPAAFEAISQLMEERLGGTWPLELDWPVTFLTAATALCVSMLASALPAWRVTRAAISEALRSAA